MSSAGNSLKKRCRHWTRSSHKKATPVTRDGFLRRAAPSSAALPVSDLPSVDPAAGVGIEEMYVLGGCLQVHLLAWFVVRMA